MLHVYHKSQLKLFEEVRVIAVGCGMVHSDSRVEDDWQESDVFEDYVESFLAILLLL